MAACSGESDANPELGNLLMQLCIPVFQITWYPYQEGSWGTQFKSPGLRPKVVCVKTQFPAHKPAPSTVLGKLKQPAHPTVLAHWKPFPLFIFIVYFFFPCLFLLFKAGFSSSAAQSSHLSSPRQSACLGCTHPPASWDREPLPLAITAKAAPQQRAGRGPQRKDLASLHWTAGFLYQRDWKHKHMHVNCPLSFWNWFLPQDQKGSCSHATAQANGCYQQQELTSTEHCDNFQSPHLISTTNR